MASFTAEEVDFVKSKGNECCRQTWLALHDQNTNSETKDEQQIKDFMIDKYERKRYYHDKGLRNGTLTSSSSSSAPVPAPTPTSATIHVSEVVKAASAFPSPPVNNGTHLRNGFKSLNGNSASATNTNDFVADFSSANFLSNHQFNSNPNGTSLSSSSSSPSQPTFANFDNNVIFNSANVAASATTNGNSRTNFSMNKVQYPPAEDRYAALKDLDNALKTQQLQQEQQLEWSTGASSNGSGYTSPLYGSPSTTGGSMYGSPCQGNFISAFSQQQQQQQQHDHCNPFAASSSPRNPWSPNGNSGSSPANNSNNTVIANNCFSSYNNGIGQNPFRSDPIHLNGTSKFNGNAFGTNGFQNMYGNSSQFMNKPTWAAPNPFSLGVSPGANGNSNNPFL